MVTGYQLQQLQAPFKDSLLPAFSPAPMY